MMYTRFKLASIIRTLKEACREFNWVSEKACSSWEIFPTYKDCIIIATWLINITLLVFSLE